MRPPTNGAPQRRYDACGNCAPGQPSAELTGVSCATQVGAKRRRFRFGLFCSGRMVFR